MHDLDHPLWRPVWETLLAQGGRLDLPAGLGAPPRPEHAAGVLARDPTPARAFGPGWEDAGMPVLLAVQGALLYLEAGGRCPISRLHARRIGRGPGRGTLAQIPGAARLLRARLTWPSGGAPAPLRPLSSAHARAEAAKRFGTAAVDRIEALAAQPHGRGDGPLVHRIRGLLLVEIADTAPSGAQIHRLAEAIPA